jgi:hypothetical protein
MALRPGSCLLISSHFIPLPRSSMIFASSSGDHFDCFLAGDSDGWAWPLDSLLAGTADAGGGCGARPGVDTTLRGTEIERDDSAAELVVEWLSSSSLGFSNNEISTVVECERWNGAGP